MSVAASTEQSSPNARAAVNAASSLPSKSAPEADLAEARWRPVLGQPCQLTVELPMPNFRVSDLLQLRVGSVIGTHWHASRDVPLRINGTLIGWSEFEVVGNRLAVRVTELA